MPFPPSPLQLKYARDIAAQLNESLPLSVELDRAVCSAYIDENKHRTPPNEKQLAYAQDIFRVLAGKISRLEFERAQASHVRMKEFIGRYEPAYKQQKIYADCKEILNKLDVIPRSLRRALGNADTFEAKLALLNPYKQAGNGFSGIDPGALESDHERLCGYWVEGLLGTAFDAFGKLDNILGQDPKKDYSYDELLRELDSGSAEGIDPLSEPPQLRHVVLKLKAPAGKDPVVISVLAISPEADAGDPRGFRWAQAREAVPRFNRTLIGATPKVPGLMFDNDTAFDNWAIGIAEAGTGDGTQRGNLRAALTLWDHATDLLSGGAGKASGVRGWIARFYNGRKLHWQTKKHTPVFRSC